MLLLTDCNVGQTLAVGYGSWDFIIDGIGEGKSPLGEFGEKVASRSRKGGPNVLQELQALAARSFDESTIVPIKNGLRLSIGETKPRYTYSMRCGCKRFYPESPAVN